MSAREEGDNCIITTGSLFRETAPASRAGLARSRCGTKCRQLEGPKNLHIMTGIVSKNRPLPLAGCCKLKQPRSWPRPIQSVEFVVLLLLVLLFFSILMVYILYQSRTSDLTRMRLLVWRPLTGRVRGLVYLILVLENYTAALWPCSVPWACTALPWTVQLELLFRLPNPKSCGFKTKPRHISRITRDGLGPGLHAGGSKSQSVCCPRALGFRGRGPGTLPALVVVVG